MLIRLIDYGLTHPLSQDIINFIEEILTTNLRCKSGEATANKLIELAERNS